MTPSQRIPQAIRRITVQADRRLAVQYFVFFARFEYALKHSRYLLAGDGDAKSDWSAFARDHNDLFCSLNDKDLLDSIAFLREHPPKREKRRDGELEFKNATPFAQLQNTRLLDFLLINCTCVVRNNLFHGAKFNAAQVDSSRDRTLLEHCAVVLSAAIELDSQVKATFENGIE